MLTNLSKLSSLRRPISPSTGHPRSSVNTRDLTDAPMTVTHPTHTVTESPGHARSRSCHCWTTCNRKEVCPRVSIYFQSGGFIRAISFHNILKLSVVVKEMSGEFGTWERMIETRFVGPRKGVLHKSTTRSALQACIPRACI